MHYLDFDRARHALPSIQNSSLTVQEVHSEGVNLTVQEVHL